MAKRVWMVLAVWAALSGAAWAAETPAEHTQTLIKALGKEKDPSLRKAVVAELARIGTPEAVAAVASVLKEPNAWLRIAATAALGTLGEQARPAVPALKAVLSDEDPIVRYNSAILLHKLKAATTAEIATPLAAALPTAPARTAEHMLKFLVGLGLQDNDVRAAVLPVLTGGPVALKRQAASAIRGDSLTPAQQPWVAEVVGALATASHDPDAEVRLGSVRVLGAIAHPTPAVTAALMAAVDDADAKVSSAAMAAMGRANPEAGATAMGHLVSRFKEAATGDERVRAAAAMGSLLEGRDTAAPVLIQAVTSDKDPAVRKQAIVTLRALRADQGMDAMLQALKSDADVKVRVAAADALSSYSTDALDHAGKRPAVLAALRAAQSDASDSVRMFAQAGVEKFQK